MGYDSSMWMLEAILGWWIARYCFVGRGGGDVPQ
jgi:hypothetical protein